MSETLKLSVKSYEIDAGTNTRNPLGLMIRGTADDGDGKTENLRMYFYGQDEVTPELVGWRATLDGALVFFLQRRDFASYLLLLDQAKATYLWIALDDDEIITSFYLSTAGFASTARLDKIVAADAADEMKKRATKRTKKR